MSKIIGREHPVYEDEDEGVATGKDNKKKAVYKRKEADEQRWYKQLAALTKSNGIDIPIVGRPKGKGTRIDFFVEAQFPDMAMEIKEQSKLFKNTNDVYRSAHYLGMYYLREILYANLDTDINRIYKGLERLSASANKKGLVRNAFIHYFEQFCQGFIEEDELDFLAETVINNCQDEELKEWARNDIKDIMSSGNMYDKMVANIRQKKTRAKQKELNLKVILNKDADKDSNEDEAAQ